MPGMSVVVFRQAVGGCVNIDSDVVVVVSSVIRVHTAGTADLQNEKQHYLVLVYTVCNTCVNSAFVLVCHKLDLSALLFHCVQCKLLYNP